MKMYVIRQQGFAAIAAIFLVVILAALGGFMLTFSNTQQLTAARDLQGSRAYWAARAGLSWAVAQVKTSPGVCTSSTATSMSSAPTSVEGFALTVTCSRSSYTEGVSAAAIYRFESKASQGSAGSSNYVERSVGAALEM